MGNHNSRYRLGLDVGSNSLGWFIIRLDSEGRPVGLGPGGVRIYPDGRDPQSKSSNAVTRRVARGARRRRDRYLKRRANVMALLVAHGLMPEDSAERKKLEGLDPFELRARALDEELPPHHVGRALFHLNQRRGFLSNRKTEKDDGESGVIKEAAGKLEAAMQAIGARTLGEFLHWRHREREPVRARNRSTGTKAEYDFYPTRQMVLAEFNAIWDKQAQFHPQMTVEARAAIAGEREINSIFFQRPLKQPPVGKCALDPAQNNDDSEGFRCPSAHPLAQRFRIWQEVRNLAVEGSGQGLGKEDGDKVALALLQNNKVSFDKLRSILKLPSEARFNLEGDKRRELKGDETAAKLSHKALFGKAWRGFPLSRQIEIVERLLTEEEPERIIAWLTAEAGVDRETAVRVANAFLPAGHSRLGLRAIKKIVPLMEGGKTKYGAEVAAYGKPPSGGDRSLNGYLPYYGEWLPDDVLGSGDPHDPKEQRWGRFPNPTVHIGLGQLRRVVNALIREYGPPTEIIVEMTRDFKLSPQQVTEIEKEQAANQRRNEVRRTELGNLGQQVNARNLLKMRLWEELNSRDPLDRCCPYTGEKISVQRLLSEEVDIDHLIPFQESWDDSAANKTVCMRYANRAKRKQTPFEAFGDSPEFDGHHYDWQQIAARAAGLPNNKRWRFQTDALQRFVAMGGFQARQLNETGWLARSAKKYLGAVTDPHNIWVLPGKLTALVRQRWGLNTLLPDHNYSDAKNRKDHRHHAIDAMVAGLTDPSLLHRMASAYDGERERIEVRPPWPSLREDLEAKLKAMVVSHKPDHGLAAQLHGDTAYGSIKEPEKEGAHFVYRKDFLTLTEKQIAQIRDVRLRELVKLHVEAERSAGCDLKSALRSFRKRDDLPNFLTGIRHVRLFEPTKPDYLVPVRDKAGKPYKFYSAGENAYVDIVEGPDGRWYGEGVTVFDANRPNDETNGAAPRSDTPLVMRVFKGDLLRIDHADSSKIVRIVRLSPSNNVLYLVQHNEAGNLQARHDDKEDPFRWIFANFDRLREWNAEPVRVDELGRVWRARPHRPLAS